MKKKIVLMFLVFAIITSLTIILFYELNIIPHKSYDNSKFNIPRYISMIDKDNDGIDDQTDIIENTRKYIETNPKYESKYYETGYPNDEYGVCTDVVGIALLNSGYDLRELVNEDILKNPSDYNIDIIDKNIDFRRVRNLNVYFEHTAISLTTNVYEIEQWQGGDVVVFKDHIGIVSDKRNKKGIPFLIHHANPAQIYYEQDALEYFKDIIIAHYRIS